MSAGNNWSLHGGRFVYIWEAPGDQTSTDSFVISPNFRWENVILDVGANVDCTAENLLNFAVMGSAYCQIALGVAEPRVGLMSNGEERGKGNSC